MGKKKDRKVACGTSQEPETNEISSKEDQSKPNGAFLMSTTKTDSSSNGNAPSLNNHYPSTLQWPYAPGVEQSHFMLIPSISSAAQSPLPSGINQWPQFPHLPQNPYNYQIHQGQQPRNYSQSAAPIWLPHWPGCALPGVNSPANSQPLNAVGATDPGWQTPAAVRGGTSKTNQSPVPNFCYNAGYTYPGFPGPCDPLSWWGQAQQFLGTYAFPGAYFSSPSASLSNYSIPLEQSLQKGIIRTPEKLSQTHQQLWQAQSAENVQLWNVISHLQSEIKDYKNRIVKLEAEVSSLKPQAEGAIAQVSDAVLSQQQSKRGRPEKSVGLVDALPSPDESPRRVRGRKPATCKGHGFEAKPHVFEKVILNKVEDKGLACHSKAALEQGNTTANYSIISQHANGNKTQAILPLSWPSSISSETEKNELNIGSEGFYNSSNAIRRGGKLIPGWSFVKVEDASE